MDIVEVIERDERAMERLATAMERIADNLDKRFAKDFPPEKPRLPGVIERPEDEKEAEFSDRADPEWIAETERTASRFQKRFDEKPKT